MKTIFKKFAVIALLLFAISATTNATTIHFKLSISNTCNSSYTGTYCARIYITLNGVSYCSKTICNLQGGGYSNDIQYECDIPVNENGTPYKIYITVCEQTQPVPLCCKDFISPFL